jgi:hypothetical protein
MVHESDFSTSDLDSENHRVPRLAQPDITKPDNPDNHVLQGSICYAVDEGFVSSRYINIGTVLEVCSVSISLGRFGHPNAPATYQRRSL